MEFDKLWDVIKERAEGIVAFLAVTEGMPLETLTEDQRLLINIGISAGMGAANEVLFHIIVDPEERAQWLRHLANMKCPHGNSPWTCERCTAMIRETIERGL